MSKPSNIIIYVDQTFAQSDFSLNVDLELPSSGITAVFGHSGSGKTTLLRCIAGLESSDHCIIRVNNQTWQDQHIQLPTHQRSLGYVFQESSLLPHLSVLKNIQFGIKRCSKECTDELFDKVISMLGIHTLLQRMPTQLSGGERQRVAIARALLLQPDLLLMDEPLASLDGSRKQEILKYLEKLHQEFKLPILYVSHSVDEVARLADHVVVMDQGRVKHQGDVHDVFSRLEIPLENQQETSVILQGRIVEKDTQWQLANVQFNGGHLWTKDNGEKIDESIRIRVLAKDVSIALSEHQDSSILNKLPATITDILKDKDPAMSLIKLQLESEIIYARLTKRSVDLLKLETGQSVWAQIKSVAIVR